MKKYVLKSTGQEVYLGQKLIKFDPSKLNHFSIIELTEKVLENFMFDIDSLGESLIIDEEDVKYII